MRKDLSAPSLAIAVAVYVPEQYARFLATAEDASDLETTWQEWYQVLQDTKQKMAALGMYPIDVTVDVDELEAYCQRQGLPNTSSTRAEYAAHLLSEQHQQQAQLQQQRPSLQQRTKKKKRRRR
ncbi:hypothetical protein [Ktedonobacter racemifer]|uniref:Uncharacterized protein n=1 Tax=Ktedonobacter racemifer DSM 44963 TaxID=485913 RepID=D6TCF6_KTERA|nr:hypothetical protein [Ktedonobacter racemifer]EFH89973.1 hypothetical protein Krac_11565 [Ktedonobacter racemifer DSM 44963]